MVVTVHHNMGLFSNFSYIPLQAEFWKLLNFPPVNRWAESEMCFSEWLIAIFTTFTWKYPQLFCTLLSLVMDCSTVITYTQILTVSWLGYWELVTSSCKRTRSPISELVWCLTWNDAYCINVWHIVIITTNLCNCHGDNQVAFPAWPSPCNDCTHRNVHINIFKCCLLLTICR